MRIIINVAQSSTWTRSIPIPFYAHPPPNAQEDCEDAECRNPLNVLPRVLAACIDCTLIDPTDWHMRALTPINRALTPQTLVLGNVSEEQKASLLRAAKLDSWRNQNCPLDKDTLGRGTWGLLHNMAIKYPEKPDMLQQEKMRGLIEGVAMFFPCKTCSKDFTESIRQDACMR